ncbi:hypothetical protein JX266_006355 [Neoarthrinium moseri]|uniref:uncharacterized protein n=1 Tax=Neoarthrinium moseri TaxID=1658444 RepID=UPI001FDC4052|nr:uncharacterized protein JN550_007140 [Neoarthrinium moseri]KAI1847503.1 hypothetical protein JX266_006355 [Neoarthrinium moseri]KAI1867409.1 hypothetical protein JN550_007140 [Neoarthrinium moseri]
MAIETVTIINNSGKIITNGKHLFGLFKEAKASYQEKKAALKAERAIKRSNTYDVASLPQYYDEVEYITPKGRRVSHDDVNSHTSSRRSHRSRHSRAETGASRSQARPALTESNLRTLSEVSSTAPSQAPVAYRSPYAETVPWESALSRPTLHQHRMVPVEYDDDVPPPVQYPYQNSQVFRSSSDPALRPRKEKEIDMDLAYGNVPPDLESRVDLDPAYKAAQKEQQAHTLMERIESLLTEAHCLHHTANHMIEHLKQKPDAAAAVALTLAELSALLGKMSPSFLGAVKAGSPAVFALLASPQFLIAAGLTVGVTVVMFGGWKIIKRIKEAKQLEAGIAMSSLPPMQHYPVGDLPMGRQPYPMSEHSAGFDEALVLEDELSTIESWRRGIAPFGEDESADLELISPEADRAMRSQYGGDDARTERSVRTSKTSRTHKTTKSSKSHKSKSRAADDMDIPERKSSKAFKDSDRASEVGSEKSHRSHRSSASKRTERTKLKAIEDGSRDRENTIDMVIRPKKDNMLKNMFKKKKERDESSRLESVLA